TPRLAWRLQDPRQGARQTAYRVVVGTDSAAVARGKGNVWDSGRRPTPDMLLTYDGPALQPLTRYYWQVRVWDKDQVPSTSETASFETGLMQTHPWQGTWIDDGHDIHYRPAPSTLVTAQQAVPIRAVDTIPARTCHRLNDTTYFFDFGQNMSGVTHIRVGGTPGTTLRLKHGERLYPDGRVDLSNIDVYHRPTDNSDPFQTDILILSGQGQDQFTPHFNYKGFRYVEVTADRPIHLDRESLTAYFIHSDVPPTGHIDASDSLIPQLCRATNRAYLSNLMGYPTDCPQREKNGWTGDSHFAIETALYNYDGFTVYEKWMADHRDEQRPDGVLPDIIPTGGWGYGTDNGLDWTSSIALIPWHLYLFYGDSKPLADCYDHIKRYVDYAAAHCTDGLTSWGRGDWVPVKSRANKELTSSTYLYVDACILARAARLFGRTDDHARYTALAAKTREAINRKYLDPQTGTYADGVQTELSVPLYWGIVPDSLRRTVARNLARQVQEAGYHLDVGVLGAKAILSALSENGEAETAYRLATQTTYPSWGNWVVNGATTLLENWDLHATRDISDNHMMFGDIGGWFFKGLGGILPDPEQPGFKHIILRPNFPQGLERFEATHLSPYGEIRSQWERQGKHITYRVTVPPNSTATFYPPVQVKDRQPLPLEAGTYEWQLEYAE
ncbi:family 78 glycoside hydrolase catalytic domain, partial [Bacteroides sp. ET71]|uniref:family 78 glycoside hydrolase catalytic domain n=1 Tax=Bacteroides sp. ET71 TaxID=2939421 RepID=UPI0020122F35